MSDAPNYVEGLSIKEPITNQGKRMPDWIKGKGTINIPRLIAFLNEQDGEWLNFDVKVSKKGNWYCAVDDWEPGQSSDRDNTPPPGADNYGSFDDDTCPF